MGLDLVRDVNVPSRVARLEAAPTWVARDLGGSIGRLASPAFGWSAIAVLLALTLVLVRSTGGSPNAMNHLGYIPVLLAAYLFGARGAIAVSLAGGLLFGPVESAIAGTLADPDLRTWVTRGVMLVAVGGVAGFLFERLRHTALRLEGALVEVTERQREGMVALARGAEAKDSTTGEHIFRCRDLASALAIATGMRAEQADDVGWAAMLHDIGKLHVPDRILLKPGKLTSEEWEVMRRHPVSGERILAGGIGFEMARRIARWHHEDFDGRGYPDGLAGDGIPLEARIVRVADAYDAMTHIRPYKGAQPPAWAFEELERYAGSQFDPELVRLFIALLERDERLLVGALLPGSIAAVLPHDTAA